MATLTDIAGFARKAVIGVGVTVVALVLAKIGLDYSKKIIAALNPPPCPEPTLALGTLPAIVFPAQTGGVTYRLETPNFSVPSFGPNIKVYFVSSKQNSLLALDRAKEQAAALGFVFEPSAVSQFVYRWEKSSPWPARLEMDIVRKNFTLDVDWELNSGFLRNKLIPDKQQAITDAKSLLKRANFMPADLENGESEATFLAYKGGEFIPVESISEADFVMVDLFRQSRAEQVNTEGMSPDQLRCMDVTGGGRILPANPTKGLARVLISGSRNQGERYVSIEYAHNQIEYEVFGTYPIISGEQAWQKLQEGKGYLAVPPRSGSEAVIRRVDLGYYDALDDSTYLQPVYIFSGDEVVAYVPAVADQYVSQVVE